jgi:hypothetical protein
MERTTDNNSNELSEIILKEEYDYDKAFSKLMIDEYPDLLELQSNTLQHFK